MGSAAPRPGGGREAARASAPRRPAPRAAGRQTPEPRLLAVDGLDVWVARKRVKNVSLRVRPAAGGPRVEVSAPARTSDALVRAFVREKRAWIDAQVSALADSPRLRAAEATPEEVAQWKAVVSACVPALVEAWEPLMGVRAGKLTYRNMTSRWGSCQPATGRICINVRLALYPPECLEYVVVHELCHLLEHGHGPRFRALMDHFMPDWRARRDKLR
ncbi:M48 family metallopeptidase [Adlercreutzia sp. ZJ176]|uniref:M48 family metallopeptidase n=2 Tax=unclassified Adlercreutzia TaxID=2636013 RepID=UPI0013EC01DA|nr:SprT family zinc-dependent metalloprotease [Adlercreutzia sp. ZJ176]